MIKMLLEYCQLYLLLKEKQKLLRLLWAYDIENIDLQTELLKVHYELKDCKNEMRRILRRE